VPGSIRRIHARQQERAEHLQKLVDEQLLSLKDPRWHYESRIKELTSFTLKIESGRCEHPESLEDFFACMLVVPNITEVGAAEAVVRKRYDIRERRPRDDRETRSAPSSFRFDDVRLYVALPNEPKTVQWGLQDVVFEVQVKTFLQHAWAIATHDLVYKCDNVNWSKERIAYQIRAMLEHAEVSIEEAESLSQCEVLAKEDHRTAVVRSAIEMLRRQWTPDELPTDVKRLAENMLALAEALGMNVEQLDSVLGRGRGGRATHPANLSPYAAAIQCLVCEELDRMTQLLEGQRGRLRVLIPAEVEFPGDRDAARYRNAVFVT
jgi:ppGpp synthetase/RelA/SpoT-type nucleotidyltranferase